MVKTKQQTLSNPEQRTHLLIYQSLGRLSFLWFVSCGTYGFYWHYMHWRFLGYRWFNAVCLTLFSPLTISGFAKHIFQLANGLKIKVGIEPKLFLFACFFGNIIASKAPGFWKLSGLLIILLPMLYLQHCLNLYWSKYRPQCRKRLFWSKGVVAWSVVGAGLWVVYITGILSEMSLS